MTAEEPQEKQTKKQKKNFKGKKTPTEPQKKPMQRQKLRVNNNSNYSNNEKKKEEKKSRTNYRMNQNIRRIINVFLGSQLSAPFSLCDSQPTSASPGDLPILGKLVSGPAFGTAHTLIGPYSCVFLPPVSSDASARALSFVGTLIVLLYIPQNRIYLVDHVDLICSLYSWWKGFRFSQPHCLWSSIVVLSPPLLVGYLQEFAPEAAPEDLGLPQ